MGAACGRQDFRGNGVVCLSPMTTTIFTKVVGWYDFYLYIRELAKIYFKNLMTLNV